MSTLRACIAVATLGVSIAAAIVEALSGRWMSSAALGLGGVYLAIGIAVGVRETLTNPLSQSFAALIGVLGLLAILQHHRAFDMQLQSSYLSATEAFARPRSTCSQSPELEKARRFGLAACATQPYRDLSAATAELSKAKEFGPALSLADSIAAMQRAPDQVACAQAYVEAEKLCSEDFLRMPESDKATLRSLAN